MLFPWSPIIPVPRPLGHDEPHKPTRSLALIEFARGLNPNGAGLSLHHLLGEFVRNGSVRVVTGQINPKGTRLCRVSKGFTFPKWPPSIWILCLVYNAN